MTVKEFKIQYALGTISYEDKIDIVYTTTSKEILTILSRDKEWIIRDGVTMNKNTPKKVLNKVKKTL